MLQAVVDGANLRIPLLPGTNGGQDPVPRKRGLTDFEKLSSYCTYCSFILRVLKLGYHSGSTYTNNLNTSS